MKQICHLAIKITRFVAPWIFFFSPMWRKKFCIQIHNVDDCACACTHTHALHMWPSKRLLSGTLYSINLNNRKGCNHCFLCMVGTQKEWRLWRRGTLSVRNRAQCDVLPSKALDKVSRAASDNCCLDTSVTEASSARQTHYLKIKKWLACVIQTMLTFLAHGVS